VKRVLALMCMLAVLVPSVALAGVLQTAFPASGQFFAEIVTSDGVDGVHHLFLGIDTVTLDLYSVQMAPSGAPEAATGRPWLYGRLASVAQLGPSTYRLFWNVDASAGGINASFIHVGQIFVDITL
jgi:hypothetical protein